MRDMTLILAILILSTILEVSHAAVAANSRYLPRASFLIFPPNACCLCFHLVAHEDAPDFIKTKRGKRAGRARLLQYKKKKQEEKERKRAAAAAAGGSGFALEVAQQDTGFNPALEW